MKDSTKEFDDLFKALIGDVERLNDVLGKSDHPLTRGAYVRAVFALLEGMTYAMKQVALDYRWHLRNPFSDTEVAILQEKNYSLNDTGQVSVRTANLPFLPNLRFAFYAFCKSHNASYSLPVTGKGWHALQHALRVRHRLMHPKSADDLLVKNAEMEDVDTAFRWFVSNVALGF